MSIVLRSGASRGGLTLLCVVAFAGCGNGDIKKLKEAGFDVSGLKTDEDVKSKARDIAAVITAIELRHDLAQIALGARNKNCILSAYRRDEANERKGDELIRGFGDILRGCAEHGTDTSDAKNAAAAVAVWGKCANTIERAVLMANMEEGAALITGKELISNYKLPEGISAPTPLDTQGTEAPAGAAEPSAASPYVCAELAVCCSDANAPTGVQFVCSGARMHQLYNDCDQDVAAVLKIYGDATINPQKVSPPTGCRKGPGAP